MSIPSDVANPAISPSWWVIRRCLPLFAFYFVWAAPRFVAIVANPLALDDFYIAKSPQDLIQLGSAVHLYSWRPLQYLEFRLFEILLSPFGKPFVFTLLPKLIGGLLLSVAATLAYRALRRCEIARPVAFLCLALFVVHPAVNELTLWNSVHAQTLALCFALFSDWLLANQNLSNRFAVAVASAVLAVLTYQVLFGCRSYHGRAAYDHRKY